MTEQNILTCGLCGWQAYHQFRDIRERMMHAHTRKHKEKK